MSFLNNEMLSRMPPSPVDTFWVLAIYDLRNVFAPRFFAWGRTCYAGAGATNECPLRVLDFWVMGVFGASASGPLRLGLGDRNNARRLNVALLRLGPHLPYRS